MNNFMVDLETMGTRPYSVIASIGVVQFDIESGKIGEKFYHTIDQASCLKLGLSKDQATIDWWKKQDVNIYSQLLVNTQPIKLVLKELNRFLDLAYPRKDFRFMWGNSAAFDLGLLLCAYERAEIEVPWQFYNERCCRTVVSLNPSIRAGIPKPRGAHDAIVDCEHQIEYVVKTIDSFRF